MTKYNHYGDLEIVGNPNHKNNAVLVTETIDFTTKMYTFPDIVSRYRFLKMITESIIKDKLMIKDVSVDLN